jgi:RNA polymerase sigma factor (sigma-70 family)
LNLTKKSTLCKDLGSTNHRKADLPYGHAREPMMKVSFPRAVEQAPGPTTQSEPDAPHYFSEFRPLIRKLIRQYGEDQEMREELEGEIYCRLDALLEAYDPDRGVPLRPYLVKNLTLAIHTYARSQWRRRRREVALEPEGEDSPAVAVVDPTEQWDRALELRAVLQGLPQAIGRLPDRQRRVVIARFYEQRSFEEIAEDLGIQVSTARSLLRFGIGNLRRQMARGVPQ